MSLYGQCTDRARKVMQLANQQAQLLNHEWVGVEHLFLGMVKEESGVAAKVLAMFGINTQNALHEISKFIQPGPDMVTMGRLPHTPRVKLIVGHANEEARKLNHKYVGTEHLLLGLLCEREGAAYDAMVGMGLNLDTIRDKVLEIISSKDNNDEDSTYFHLTGPFGHTLTVRNNIYFSSTLGEKPDLIGISNTNRLQKRIANLESDLSESIAMLNDLFRRVGEMLDSETAKRLTDILDKHGVPKK